MSIFPALPIDSFNCRWTCSMSAFERQAAAMEPVAVCARASSSTS